MEDSLCIDLRDDEYVRRFQEQGFLKLGRLTTDQELTWLRNVYDTIVKQKMGYTPDELGCVLAGSARESLVTILSPDSIVPELTHTIFYRNTQRIFTRLLNVEEPHLLSRWRIFLKPAYSDETPWHQDAAYRPPPPQGASVWMSLDSATCESGCLQYISGSQLGCVRPHQLVADNLVATDVDCSQATVCALSLGEATIHHSRTLHSAGPNRTDKPRRAIAIICQTVG